MKTSDILILAVAAAAAWWLVKGGGRAALVGGDLSNGTLANKGDGKWHYYDNGVTVDPAGNYLRDGVLIWSPYAQQQQ